MTVFVERAGSGEIRGKLEHQRLSGSTKDGVAARIIGDGVARVPRCARPPLPVISSRAASLSDPRAG
jgi:hypothetical protein